LKFEKRDVVLFDFSEANGRYFVTNQDRQTMKDDPVLLAEVQGHMKARRLRCGVCEVVLKSPSLYQATLPYRVPVDWSPSSKIDAFHLYPRSAFKICPHCGTLSPSTGPLAVVYVCSEHGHFDLPQLVRAVKQVPRFNHAVDGKRELHFVTYTPVSQLERVHFDMSKVRAFLRLS
jgi:hypothetical protein